MQISNHLAELSKITDLYLTKYDKLLFLVDFNAEILMHDFNASVMVVFAREICRSKLKLKITHFFIRKIFQNSKQKLSNIRGRTFAG